MPGCHTLLLEIPSQRIQFHRYCNCCCKKYLAQLPASSKTSATRYSRVAARYTAAFTLTYDEQYYNKNTSELVKKLTLFAYRSFFSLLWTLDTGKTRPAFFVLLTGFFFAVFLNSFALPLLVFSFFGSFPPPLLKDNLLTALATAAAPGSAVKAADGLSSAFTSPLGSAPADGVSFASSSSGTSSTSSAAISSPSSSIGMSTPSWLRPSVLL